MRKEIKSEEVFYIQLKRLIENQLINDPNFKGDWNRQSWYEANNKMDAKLFHDKAEYILEQIESMRHLILEE